MLGGSEDVAKMVMDGFSFFFMCGGDGAVDLQGMDKIFAPS